MRTSLALVASVSLVASSGSSFAQAKDACEPLVRSGLSIGRVQLGMTLDEVKALGAVTALEQPKGWHEVKDKAAVVRFQLGADKKVESIRHATKKVCLLEGALQREIDMRKTETRDYSPFPDCGRTEAAHFYSWQCPAHGLELGWEGKAKSPVVGVRRPEAAVPFAGVPPVPSWKAEKVACAASGPQPNPELGCGFFGGKSLTLECYLTNPCVGQLAPEAPDHVDAHGPDGVWLGSFQLVRNAQSLALKIPNPEAGRAVRILFDREIPVARDARPDAAVRPVVWVAGARQVPNGMVLELTIPQPPKCALVFEGRCYDDEAALCAAKGCQAGKCKVAKGESVTVSCTE